MKDKGFPVIGFAQQHDPLDFAPATNPLDFAPATSKLQAALKAANAVQGIVAKAQAKNITNGGYGPTGRDTAKAGERSKHLYTDVDPDIF